MQAGGDNPIIAALVKMVRDEGRLEILADGSDSTVARLGDTVFKVHAPETVERELLARLRVAEVSSDVLLSPQSTALRHIDGRLVSAWPYARPLPEDEPDAIPWERAGEMLAALHRVDLASVGADPLPEGGGPRRLLRAIRLLRAAPPSCEKDLVLGAFETLPPEARRQADVRRLIHGDWHLGQLVHLEGAGWRLIDVDELGTGDPVWDLARPAAWFACGLIPGGVWHRFLSGYRDGAGPGVSTRDPWAELDAPARAIVVQSVARVVEKAQRATRPYDATERALIDACRRILRPEDGEP